MFSNTDLPDTGTVDVHFAGADEAFFDEIPARFVAVHGHDHGQAVILGDGHGEVARFPFTDATRETEHLWRFTGPEDDFYLTFHPEEQ
jgi:hypothetical protein